MKEELPGALTAAWAQHTTVRRPLVRGPQRRHPMPYGAQLVGPIVRETVLFIEYDVTPSGDIEVVALINAVEENDEDADGSAWMAWRAAEFDDNGLGCVGVPAGQLALMEGTEDADALRAVVERIILDDRATKEEVSR